MIFGRLLTSGNYKKGEKRTVGGKNGYGAKIVNIFSNEFNIELVDRHTKKKYIQTFSENIQSLQNLVLQSQQQSHIQRLHGKLILRDLVLMDLQTI